MIDKFMMTAAEQGQFNAMTGGNIFACRSKKALRVKRMGQWSRRRLAMWGIQA